MVDNYRCICPDGYHGDHCENKPCDVNPCRNNGICRNMFSGYKCICAGGYDGDNCEWNYRYFTDTSGILSSPNYPGNYTNNLRYKYFIRLQAGQSITPTFSRIITEKCCDHVQVFEGSTISDPPLLKLSGSSYSSTTVQSTSNNMLVVFTSDGSIIDRGFTATYSSHS
ncbi:unnamed protein product [Mytilus coruscus]|uniref:CUBN n=1 Tax=Mytilus coruscus TaxID=42192 RepID=A0A6J7ZWS1_MYTCO|nr:unnamed protein product [Mytilus coruscus]